MNIFQFFCKFGPRELFLPGIFEMETYWWGKRVDFVR